MDVVIAAPERKTATTTTAHAATLEAERYLKEVAPQLAALPAEERADLLDDLAQHLGEIAAEPGPPLVERLGSPEAYAAELLASAGSPSPARGVHRCGTGPPPCWLGPGLDGGPGSGAAVAAGGLSR